MNNQNNVQSSFVIGDTYISAHLLNGICLRDRHKAGTTIIKTRKITPEKEVAFSNKLNETDWSPILEERGCNRKWELFTNSIKSALDETCPEKEVKIRSDAGPNRVPWMTEGLNTSEIQLKKLMKKANKNPNGRTDGNTKTHWEQFREYRATHSKVRRRAKRDYYNNKFKEVKHDSRATWNLLNKFTCNKRTNNKIKELRVGNDVLTSNQETAKAFNKFYANVGTLQAETIPPSNKDPLSYLSNEIVNSMFLHPTNKEEIDKACKSLAKKVQRSRRNSDIHGP